MILGMFDEVFEWSPWKKLGLLAFGVVVVVVVDWQWWYGPNAEILSELEGNVNTRQAELDTRLSKTNARADAERELRDLTAELKRAQARLPDQREIADLLTNVAASGRSAGLEIVLFRQKPEIYRDFYAEVPVEMQMRGTYHDVARFLDNVKRLDRIVNVTDIKLARPRVEGDQVKLEASCTTTTFRFLDEAERQRLREQQKKDGKKDPGKSA